MNKPTYKLRVQRGEAIKALLEEPTVTAAAKRLGVNRSTLHRWMQRPDFAAALEAARRGQDAEAEQREREEKQSRWTRRPWYGRGDTPKARRIMKAIHERACELFPRTDPGDPRLMLAMWTSNDSKLLHLRKQAKSERVII